RPGECKRRRTRALYAWVITIVLAVAGFVFAVLALEPFKLGWKGYLYSAGAAVVLPFLVEKVIERWGGEKLLRWMAGLACASALISLMALAVIRGNLFAEAVRTSAPTVVLDDEPSPQASENTFYERNVPLLCLVMVLLSLAMDLGAGIALYDAWQASYSE